MHGLKRKEERDAAENAPRRQRLISLEEEIKTDERKVKRLISDFGDLDDEDPVYALMRAEVKTTSRRLAACRSEHARVLTEIEATELTKQQRNDLLLKAAALRIGMPKADFVTKRYFIDRLDVHCTVRREDDIKRWLDITCSISLDPDAIALTSSGIDISNSAKQIVFSADVPIQSSRKRKATARPALSQM